LDIKTPYCIKYYRDSLNKFTVPVAAVPYFTEEPEIKNEAEDETVEFRCAASGVPEPQIKWIHNGVPIEKSPPNPRRKVRQMIIRFTCQDHLLTKCWRFF
jgi:hypothetical protein